VVFSSKVEQRRESRFKPNQLATVRVLALRPGPVLPASVLDISGNGLRLRLDLPLPCGAPIEIEWDHSLSRGIICRCEIEEESYEIGIQVSETGPIDQ
jgi:PilZ domain